MKNTRRSRILILTLLCFAYTLSTYSATLNPKTVTSASTSVAEKNSAQNVEVNLLITEIMFNPASPENDWEWIELYNAGNQMVDLSGFVIDDNNSTAHTVSNIAAGVVAPGAMAVLYNADDITAEDFAMAWGSGINLVAVTNWSVMGLNNSTDTIGLWQNYEAYNGDHVTHTNALISVSYPDIDDNAGSVFLKNLQDLSSFQLSTLELIDALGGTAYKSLALAGNSGEDVGSPGNLSAMPPEALEILEFVLVDANTGAEIMPITENTTINLSNLSIENFSIKAIASEDTESVFFELNGERNFKRTENIIPYALFGDKAGKYNGKAFKPGNYILSATPFSEDRLGGVQGRSLNISFELTIDLSIDSFVLVDADNNSDIMTISDGMTIESSKLPTQNLNIRAASSAGTESVQFVLSGSQKTERTENKSPYALFGDRSGEFFTGKLSNGSYSLLAIPYPKNGLKGKAGSALTINFEMLDATVFFKAEPKNQLKIYPNPAKVEVSVSFDPPVAIQKLALFDIYGRQLKRYPAGDVKSGNEYRLYVGDLPEGIYFICIEDNNGIQLKKELILD